MTIDLWFFFLSLLLLWYPRQWMRRGAAFLRRRRRSAESARITEPWGDREPGDPRIRPTTEFAKFRNYLDLFRAGIGGLLLSGGMGIPAAIGMAGHSSHGSPLQVVAIRAAVLLVGVLIQALRFEKHRISFFPPIFYLTGLFISLGDIRGAALAFILIWAVNPVLPNAQAFLSMYAVVIVIFGYFFGGAGVVSAGIAGMLCFLPVLLSLLANRPLMIFARKGTRAPKKS